MKNIYIILALFGGLIILFIDSITALGFTPWMLYIILLFVYITYSDKKYLLALTFFYAALLTLGYFISPPIQADYIIPVVNRIIGFIIMVMMAFLGFKEQSAKNIRLEILERIKDLFFEIDNKFRIIFLNKTAKQFVGINEDAIGKNLFDAVPFYGNALSKSRLNQAFTSNQHVHYELQIPNAQKVLDISLYATGKEMSIFAKDISERVTAENKLKNIVHEKDMLMREMQHRTKNNFQLVLSLLNLQIHNLKDEIASRILNETRARLLSITILYDKLFNAGDFYTVNMRSFITDIMTNMETAVNFGMLKMHNQLNIENSRIGSEAALPIGLIINELYTNSLKYAFDGNSNGSVFLEMKFIDSETLHVIYRDSGKGLPDNFILEKSEGLGSSIISGFVDQLDGSITCKNNNGAEFEMKLKVVQNQKTIEISRTSIEPILNNINSNQ